MKERGLGQSEPRHPSAASRSELQHHSRPNQKTGQREQQVKEVWWCKNLHRKSFLHRESKGQGHLRHHHCHRLRHLVTGVGWEMHHVRRGWERRQTPLEYPALTFNGHAPARHASRKERHVRGLYQVGDIEGKARRRRLLFGNPKRWVAMTIVENGVFKHGVDAAPEVSFAWFRRYVRRWRKRWRDTNRQRSPWTECLSPVSLLRIHVSDNINH